MSELSDKNRRKAEERILKAVTIKCKECQGNMVRVVDLGNETILGTTIYNVEVDVDLGNETIVGYSCQDCSHYYLFH